ncbi:enoyl-CoA hydratase-related protein [Aeromicrobium sp. UC242_57]|uniref:enoyl-CoA hydratase-related protein n=1 Tax=Aeromicrobium sp. UC242_57 TaxID=3374624 RepID=UPI00378E6915
MLAAFEFGTTCDDVRAIVVTGAGDTFSHGTDLRAPDGFSAGSGAFKPLRGGRRDVGGELAVAIYRSTRPVIAAINGTAVGIGVSMVLPMDIRVCSATSRFAVPFVRRGIVPESCSTWFLPRIVGISTAMYWATTGKTFTADEALAQGLVQEVVPQEDVLSRAMEIASGIASHSAPIAVALTRQMMWRGLSVDHPMTANELESEALLHLGALPDAREGVQSFLERRAPIFPTPASQTPAPYPWWVEPEFQAPES